MLASFINRQGTEQFPMTQLGEYQPESPKLATLILRFNFQTGQASSQIGNIAQASPCDILEGLVFSLRTSCKGAYIHEYQNALIYRISKPSTSDKRII